MVRVCLTFVLIVLVLFNTHSSLHAQSALIATETKVIKSASGDTAADNAKPGDNADLLRVLEDPVARNTLIARIKALQKQTSESPTAVKDAAIMDDLMGEVQERQEAVQNVLVDVGESWRQLPFLLVWLKQQLSDPTRRAMWRDAALRLSIIFAIGIVGRTFVRERLFAKVGQWTSRHPLQMLIVGICSGATFLALTVPPLHFFGSTYMVRATGIQLMIGLVGFWFWGTLITGCLGKGGFISHQQREAGILERTLKRSGQVGIFGYFAVAAARVLGLPNTIGGFIEHIVFFGVMLSLCIMVLRIREWVAAGLRKRAATSQTALSRFMPMSFLASTWHIFAIIWIVVHYLVWALNIPGGFFYLARATLLTTLILAFARTLVLWIDRSFASGVPIAADADELLPGVQERATRYANPLRLLLRGFVIGAMVLLLLEAWETRVVEWLGTDTGKFISLKIFSLVAICTSAVLASEGLALLIERFVGAKDEQGKPLHSNRARTLASILKNVLILFIVTTAMMLALSEIGVDAAALLAGAGVVGLAIGFGSQRLVQDLINGLFILLGDTLRVGDVVEVGGKSGVVESITMRTIALRSYDGSVHTIPYSSIDIITNMTKDFSYAVLDIGVAYREDVDQVMKVMGEVDAGLRREWPYRRIILEPLDIAGVDALGESSVMIKARSKVHPGKHWGVRRELVRRLKRRFDELGIEIPFPHQTVYFGADRDGKAPPLFIEKVSRDMREEREKSDIAEEKT